MPLLDLPNDVIEALDILDLRRLTGLRFVVQIDGDDFRGKETVAGFSVVEGLGGDLDMSEVSEAGYPGVHTFPRRERLPALTMRRPMTFSRSLWNWYLAARHWTKGRPDYTKSMSIFLMDTVYPPGLGEIVYEAYRWDFFRCWPSRWVGPRLDALASTGAEEAVVVQHSGTMEARGVLSGRAGEILSLFQ